MMLERFTQESRMVLFVARELAGERGSESVQNVHLLLGILHVVPTVVTRSCPSGCSAEALQERLLATLPTVLPREQRLPMSVEMAIAPGMNHTLVRASEEAATLASPEVRPEHILLGLLDNEDDHVASLLRESDISRQSIISSLPPH
jgi:ATP-dependent Clp protease ATP-binding subunit ClpA